MSDNEEPIECKICGDEIGPKGFPIHLSVHGKDYKEYVEEHIEDFEHLGWTFCVNCGDLTKSYGDKIPTCSQECSSDYRKEYYSGEGNPRYGVEMSEETKRKIGEKAKKRLSNPENHWNYGNKWSDEVKKKISETQRKNVQKEDYVNPMTGETHSEEAIEKIFNSFTETSLEKGAKEVLDEYEIEYEYQFFLTTEDGDIKSYDFYLPEYRTILEMDGDYWHGGPGCEDYHDDVELTRANDKLKEKLAESRGYCVVRVWESEFKENENIILERLEISK